MRRRVVIASTAVLVVALLVGAVAIGVGEPMGRASASPSTTRAATTAPSPPSAKKIPARGITSYEIGASTAPAGQWISADGGFVWAFTDKAVVRLDGSSGAPSTADFVGIGLDAVDEGVWSIDRCPRLLQLEAPDGTVLREFEIPLSPCGPYEVRPVIASTADTVWVLGGPDLLRVDLATGHVEVIALIPGGSSSTRQSIVVSLAADTDGVWISIRDKFWHVSAATNAIDAEFSIGGRYVVLTLALYDDALWATAMSASTTPDVAVKAMRFEGGSSPSLEVPGVAKVFSSDGTLWFVGYWPKGISMEAKTVPLRVGQLDSLTGRITRSTTFTYDQNERCCDAAAGDGALWLHLGSTLYRIPNA